MPDYLLGRYIIVHVRELAKESLGDLLFPLTLHANLILDICMNTFID